MGREIVYCCQCQRRIVGDELDKGTAYQVGNKITCSSCALQVLETLPPREKEALLAKMFRETKDRRSPPARSPGASPTPRKALSPIPAPAPGPNVGLIAGLAVGAIVVVIIVVMALAGSRDPVETPKSAPAVASPEDQRRQAAAEAIRKARDFARSKPAEIDAQVTLWQDAVFAADRTPYLADAKSEHEAAKLRQRESLTKELNDLELTTSALLGKQEYKAALDGLDAARARRSIPDWTTELTRRSKAVESAAASELIKVLEAAAVAKRKGFEEEVAALRARVALWGLPKYGADFDKALAGVSLPAPLTDPALVAYWPLDEGSGTTTNDSTGKLAGKIRGAAWTPGKFGSALRFDGVRACVELPNTSELDRLQTGSYTLSLWVNLESRPAPGGGSYGILMKPGYHMGLSVSEWGRFQMGQWFLEKQARYAQFDSGTAYETGRFHHVASVVDATAGVTRVYVNSVLDKEGSWIPKTPTVDFQSNPWRIGAVSSDAGDSGSGSKTVIDDVRLYSRALSAAEVGVLFQARPAAGK